MRVCGNVIPWRSVRDEGGRPKLSRLHFTCKVIPEIQQTAFCACKGGQAKELSAPLEGRDVQKVRWGRVRASGEAACDRAVCVRRMASLQQESGSAGGMSQRFIAACECRVQRLLRSYKDIGEGAGVVTKQVIYEVIEIMPCLRKRAYAPACRGCSSSTTRRMLMC
eukprot:303803-Pelagomonas_calceolata.AAC.5